jgi:hypothetical protein
MNRKEEGQGGLQKCRGAALKDAEREGDEEEGEGEGGERVAGEVAPEDVQAGLRGRRAEGDLHQLLPGATARTCAHVESGHACAAQCHPLYPCMRERRAEGNLH